MRPIRPFQLITLGVLPLPRMVLNPDAKDIFAFQYDDFDLQGYRFHPHIPAPIAV